MRPEDEKDREPEKVPEKRPQMPKPDAIQNILDQLRASFDTAPTEEKTAGPQNEADFRSTADDFTENTTETEEPVKTDISAPDAKETSLPEEEEAESPAQDAAYEETKAPETAATAFPDESGKSGRAAADNAEEADSTDRTESPAVSVFAKSDPENRTPDSSVYAGEKDIVHPVLSNDAHLPGKEEPRENDTAPKIVHMVNERITADAPPIDTSFARRETISFREPEPAAPDAKDAYNTTSLDERLAVLRRLRDEYRYGVGDDDGNGDFSGDTGSVTETETAEKPSVPEENKTVAPPPVKAQPRPSPVFETDTPAEPKTFARAEDAEEKKSGAAPDNDAVIREAQPTTEDNARDTDKEEGIVREIPDIGSTPAETPSVSLFGNNTAHDRTENGDFADLETVREEITDEPEIPEEIASPEPFNDDDYIISDRSIGEEMATGQGNREYVSYNQNTDIADGFRTQLRLSRFRLILVSFFSTLLLVSENVYLFGWQIPFFVNDFGIRGLPVLLNLQILLWIALLSYPQFLRGISSLKKKRFGTEAYAIFLFIPTVIYDVILYITATDARMFSFCTAFYFLLAAVFDFIRLNDDYMTFEVVSSTARKTVSVSAALSGFRDESAALRGIIDDGNALLSETRRAGFAEGFFARSRAEEEDNLNVIAFAVAAVAALMFSVISYFAVPTFGVVSSIGIFVAVFSAAIPFSSVFVRRYPFAEIVKKSVLSDTAVVGEYSATEYASTKVFVMEDTELFPTRNVKVKGIKLFGDNRLDRVLCQVSALFRKTGGPLSNVFGTVGPGVAEITDVTVREIAEKGIAARLDGNMLLVGDGEFMEQHHVTLLYDSEDARQIDGGKVSIMYVAENGVISARFYLQYIPNPDFEKTAERLAKEGIAVIVRTFDPNVSDRLINKVSYIGSYPVRVVRKDVAVLDEDKKPRLPGGIVTTNGVGALVDLLFRCLRFVRVASLSPLFRILNTAFGTLLAIVLLAVGRIDVLGSGLIVLSQVFWFIPVYLITKIFIRE